MRASVAEPHEHLPVLIDGELLDAQELNFHIFQVVVIELKLALERPIGDALPPAQFESASKAMEIVYHPAGEWLVRRDGPPLEHLYVIRKGAVRLERDAQTLQLLEHGEVFGYTSLITGNDFKDGAGSSTVSIAGSLWVRRTTDIKKAVNIFGAVRVDTNFTQGPGGGPLRWKYTRDIAGVGGSTATGVVAEISTPSGF